MREIGSWTTAEGTVPATLDVEWQDADAQELPGWVKNAAAGALTGAMTGMAAGPYGALAGAVAGGALGASGVLKPPAAPAPAAPPPTPPVAPSPPAGTVPPTPTTSPTSVATALQQLAAILPLLIQTATAGGAVAPKPTGESFESFESFDEAAEIGLDLEALEPSEWEFASQEGGWTIS